MRQVRERGSALIAVLWLAAAMTAIAFALAATVRTEAERAESASEGLRTYYLAESSIDRALLWIRWGAQYRRPDGSPMFYQFPTPRLEFRYPSGVAAVEIIPESAKFNVNTITGDNLFLLLSVLGAPEPNSRMLTGEILDWRSGSAALTQNPLGSFNAPQGSSFPAPHASIRELEELLLLRGMTPDLFYGNYSRDPEGRATWHAGLRDCLTTFGQNQAGFDINTVEPAVMATLGLPLDSINQIVALRSQRPIRAMDDAAGLVPSAVAGKLRVGGGSIITLRATARLLLPNGQISDLKRSVAAVVKLEGSGHDPDTSILRWYDNAQSGIL